MTYVIQVRGKGAFDYADNSGCSEKWMDSGLFLKYRQQDLQMVGIWGVRAREKSRMTPGFLA